MHDGRAWSGPLLEARLPDECLPDDRLLAQFTASGSPAAFQTLIRRHAGLVYGAALRQVRDPHLADEITQSVFVLLSRKAATIGGDRVLAGWLLKTTRFVALDALKLRERRRRHETRAAAMHADRVTDHEAVAAIDNADLLGALDDGLLSLNSSDRRAILMRYYESKPYDDIGRHLGIDAEAARKRVGRAVERLRDYFVGRRGKTATATAIVALLGLELRTEAPPPVIARAIRFSGAGESNALADLASDHLLRVNVLRWSLVGVVLTGLFLISGSSLRSSFTLATSAVAHSTPSSDAPAN